jgi:phosphatidylglycerophosphate synthase
MDKVPEGHRVLDVSDYARPLAQVLVRLLLPTQVTPVHLTLAHTAVGLLAAMLFALDRGLPLAGALLLLKSALDAADGSLARARGRPSRVGRFLDSIGDVSVTIAVFFGIAAGAWRRDGQAHWALAALAMICATLQCSVFNYYYVRYRAQTGGDTTSDVNEDEARGYAWDNPRALRALHGLYRLIYGWQDSLMDHIDTWAARRAPVTTSFLTATTALGLGAQLLITAVCAALGQPVWALWIFVIPFNFYWIALIFVRFLGTQMNANKR